MFCFALDPMDAFELQITVCSHFLLSKRSLSFNNVMFTLTSAQSSARFVEEASGLIQASLCKN